MRKTLFKKFAWVLLVMMVSAIGSLQANPSQSKTVTGIVTSGTNDEPLIGVSVQVKETGIGGITDIDGKYAVTAQQGQTLVFSYIGYVTQEIKVGASSGINVALMEDNELLDEVVVVGYGAMKKSDLTGSVASVDAEEMMKRNPVSLGQGLQGAAAGVSVIRSSGDPEGKFSIRIRGVATVNGSSDPLYVVDGVQVGTSIEFLNPNDVESIDILKDASATAIYGTRGANGVVMITTKNANKGKAKVNFSANYALQFNANKIDVADASLFAQAVQTAVKYDETTFGNEAYSPAYAGKLNSIDWQDEMSRVALQQNYNLSASGGTENTQASFSIGYLNNDGVVIESNFKRLTARANITHKVKDFLQIGGTLNYFHSEKVGGGNLREFASAIPTMDYVENGTFYSMPIVLPNGSWGHYFNSAVNSDINGAEDNFVAKARTRDGIYKGNRLIASAFVNIDLFKGLTFKTIGNYNYSTGDSNGYTLAHQRTFTAKTDKDFFYLNQNQKSSLGLETFLTYDWSNDTHRVNAMAGFSTSDTYGAWLEVNAKDFPAINIRDIALTNDPATKQSKGALDLKSRFVSYFARATYALKDRYILTSTIRRDGSSNFGEGNRWGTFPSASFAWRISEEDFIKNLGVFSNLKLRAGWGQTGNAGGGTNLSVPQLSSERVMYYLYMNGVVNAPGMAQLKEVDTNLKWETNEQTNIGLDFAFMNNELSFSLDYFIRDAKDLLLYRQIRPSTGYTSIYTNAGHIRNSGFELNASWNKSFGDWQFGVNMNASTLKNEAIEVGDPIYSTKATAGDSWNDHSVTKNGYPVGSYYGYKVAGIFRDQAEIDEMNRYAAEKGAESGYYQLQTTKPGDYKFVDINGDGTITDADRTVLGDGYPTLTYGANLTASYKNFDFSMNLYGVAGMEIFSYSAAKLTTIHGATGGYQNVLAEYVTNSWTEENRNAKYPRISKTDYNSNVRASDAYLRSGDYLKISNIQIGYTLPKSALKALKMDYARVFVNVDNPCTISSYNKYGDPEVTEDNVLYSGYDGGRYPFPMAVTFGLNVQF